MGKLINRRPGLCLLISSILGSLLERLLNRSANLTMSTSVLKALLSKLDIKRHSPSILNLYLEATLDNTNPDQLKKFEKHTYFQNVDKV